MLYWKWKLTFAELTQKSKFKPQFYAHELDWHDVFTVKLTTIKQVFTFDFLFKVLLELVLKRTYPIQ